MKITEVKINKVELENSSCKGFATIILDDCLVINKLRIVIGKSRRFVAMPSIRDKEGNYKDVVYPLNNQLMTEIETAIFTEFDWDN